jgi:hypothetical protein
LLAFRNATPTRNGCKLVRMAIGIQDHSENAGKRRWTRHKSDAPIKVFAEGPNDKLAIEGHCITTSDGGLCFFAVGNFDLGSQINVEFMNRGSGKFGRVRGTIRNRAVYLYGVEYETSSGESSHCWAPTENQSTQGKSPLMMTPNRRRPDLVNILTNLVP